MERLAYLLKQWLPGVFQWVEATARAVTRLRFGRRIAKAENQAFLEGSVDGNPAAIRSLDSTDAERLHQFLAYLPPDWLEYFQPHPLDRVGLEKVLKSPAFMNYGLFINSQIAGYALLKVAPTGSAFIGRLVSPAYGGQGLGKFLARYLYWQASLAGLSPRSTISRQNYASLKSHQAVTEYRVVAELPNNYLMIEFPLKNREKPELCLPGKGEKHKGQRVNGITGKAQAKGERRKGKNGLTG